MAARRRRSASLDISPNVVAKPYKASKRKKTKNLSDAEKKKVVKHEIRGDRFTYRLRSVKNILKNMNDEADKSSPADGESSKKTRRKSTLKGGKRRSIAENVLIKNFEMSAQGNKQDETLVDQNEEDGKETTNVDDENVAKCSKENSDIKILEDEKQTELEEAASNNKISGQKREKHIPHGESEEEVKAREATEQKAREETLKNIKKLQEEQTKWIELYESYQKRLLEDQSNAESTSSLPDEICLSEEQKEILAGRVDAEAFIERLQTYQTQYISYAKRFQDFTERMQQFKESASNFLKSHAANNNMTPTKDREFETPRRLITKLVQGDMDCST